MWFLYTLLFGVPLGLYFFSRRFSSFWKENGVAFIPGWPFVGNIGSLLCKQTSGAEMYKRFYFDPNVKDEPVVGINVLLKPALVIREPELIKRIFVKDFDSFTNRHVTGAPTDHIGYYNLFMAKFPEWKDIRAKLKPLVIGVKMRKLFYLMNDIGEKLNVHLKNLKLDENTNSARVEIKELLGCFTTDVIASCAFGTQANSIENPNVDFRVVARNIFETTISRAFQLTLFYFLPELVPYTRFVFFGEPANQFLRKTMNEAFAEREKSGKVQNDMIDTLLELKRQDKDTVKAEGELKYEGDILVAQTAIIYVAGYMTTACTSTFALFEIAKNPVVQKRIRDEIRTHLKKSHGQITYDNVYEMKYLDQVIYETMRLYPIIAYLDRECTNEKGYSLEPYSKFVIPKGMPCMIPIIGLHRDPKYFPNPDVFDPERFADAKILEEKQYIYMPFGVGPRNCTGIRFGMYTMKIGLINLFRNYYVKPTENTPKELVFQEKALLESKTDIELEFIKDTLA